MYNESDNVDLTQRYQRTIEVRLTQRCLRKIEVRLNYKILTYVTFLYFILKNELTSMILKAFI